VQILSIDLGTDILPALALVAEKPTKEVMKKQPRSHKERLFRTKLKQLQDFLDSFMFYIQENDSGIKLIVSKLLKV